MDHTTCKYNTILKTWKQFHHSIPIDSAYEKNDYNKSKIPGNIKQQSIPEGSAYEKNDYNKSKIPGNRKHCCKTQFHPFLKL
jgi:hypothetical protein